MSYSEQLYYTASSTKIVVPRERRIPSAISSAHYIPTSRTDDPFSDYESYDVPGWDGYDAEPITADTVRAARYFARVLPHGVQLRDADIAPGADGTIGFEWRHDGRVQARASTYVEVGPGWTVRAFKELNGKKRMFPAREFRNGIFSIVQDVFLKNYE